MKVNKFDILFLLFLRILNLNHFSMCLDLTQKKGVCMFSECLC